MRKKLSVLFLFTFIFLNIQGQEFGGGIILGLSSSQVSGDNLGGFNKAGFLVGAFANKKISNLFALQMEITYIQKGSHNPNMNTVDHVNYNKPDITLSYIEVPVLLRFLQYSTLDIEAGILGGRLIKGYYNDYAGKINEYNGAPFIKNDLGFLLGINYVFRKKLSLNTRISQSILPIGKEDSSISNIYNSSKKGKYNSVLSFALHYNI